MKDLTTSVLSVGLQQSKALCQMCGESLEVLKSEQTNTEHRGEETCPGSESRLEGQLAQILLVLYVPIACTVRQDCLRALTYCVHFWPGCCRLQLCILPAPCFPLVPRQEVLPFTSSFPSSTQPWGKRPRRASSSLQLLQLS